jgi:thiamine biosynthesis protein ThiI
VKYELIIVRYGEIALKGREIRKRFENTLVSNIKSAFSAKTISNKIKKEWGRIYVYTTQINKCVDVLKKIFGIISISPALQTTSDMDSMSKLAVDVSKEELNQKKSFAIRATRTGAHKFTSQDVAIKIGDEVVKATKANVDLTNPDFELFIEIRNDKAFLFSEKIRCVGGMPLGTQGNILALIDSSESILAAWYLMHRGCKTIFLNVTESKNILKSFAGNWFVKLDISAINSENNIYEEINKIAYERNCDAIVTGHTIFGDSKNVLYDIKQLKKHVKIPILHPLIAMNGKEINNKCKKIGLTL